MAQEIVNIAAETFENLERLYTFDDSGQVKWYLETHPYLIEVLREAHIRVRKFFPIEELVLEIVSFRKSIGGRELVLSIEATGDMWQALTVFSQFKSSWWFYAHHPYDGVLSILVQHKDMERGDPWQGIASLIGTVEAPPDWSAEHDHYFYGTPKRGDETSQ